MPKKKPQRAAPDRLHTRARGSAVLDSFLGKPLALISLLLAVFAVAQAWSYAGSQVCIDYYQFWAVGRVLHESGVRDVYSDAERRSIGKMMWEKARAQVGPDAQAKAASKRYQAALYRQTLETYSTPWLYTCFALLSSGDYDRDQNLFQYFCLICYVLAVVGMCNILGYSPGSTALAVASFLYWFGPTVSDTDVGNINRLELAILALFLWMQRSDRPAAWQCLLSGILLGSGVMFKPNLGFVVLILLLGWLVFRCHRKLVLTAAGMALGCLASFAISAAYFHSMRPWLDWAKELPRLMNELDIPLSHGNYALARLVAGIFGFRPSLVLPPLFIGSVVIVLLRAGFAGNGLQIPGSPKQADRKPSLKLDVLLIGLGGTVSLLSAQLAWLHYYLLTMPLALYLLRPGESEGTKLSTGRRVLRWLALLAVLMIALEPFKAIFNLTAAGGKAALVSGGAILLFTLALLDCLSCFQGSALKPGLSH